MKKQRTGYIVVVIHLGVIMTLFGAILCETFLLYPNIFHDIPHSLETGMKFMAVRGPQDFFPSLGMLVMLTGIVSLIFYFRKPPVNYLILSSMMMIFVGEFLLSMFYFWPRNTIMFVEGAAVHSISILKQTAQEFQTGHWFRVIGCGVAALLSWWGFFRIDRINESSGEIL